MVYRVALGIVLAFVIVRAFPFFFALAAELFGNAKPEEKPEKTHDSDGIAFYPTSQLCGLCMTQNNPQYAKCWKCSGDLPLAILKAQLEILSVENARQEKMTKS